MLRMILATVLISLYLLSPLQGTWKPEYAQSDPKLLQWYQNAKDAKGNGCCSDADGHAYYGNVATEPDGSVIVEENGKLYKVEKDKVLTGPNPTGHAVWWYYDYTGYEPGTVTRTTRCFALGSGI